MPPCNRYAESVMRFDKPCTDFYAIQIRIRPILSAYPGVSYAPLGTQGNFYGAIFRGFHGASMPGNRSSETYSFQSGQLLKARGGFVFSDPGDGMRSILDEETALASWASSITQSGFLFSEDTAEIERSAAYFYDPEARQEISFAFWSIVADLTIVDPFMAAQAMVYGIGSHKKLGFGMLKIALLS